MTTKKPTIVFCHGIWADGSCFSKVIPALQADGHEVISVQYSLESYAEDLAIVKAGLNFLFGRILKRLGDSLSYDLVRKDLFAPLQVETGQLVVIQSGLADRDDARILRELAQRRNDVFLGFLDISWMNADNGENIRVFFRQLHCAPAAFD